MDFADSVRRPAEQAMAPQRPGPDSRDAAGQGSLAQLSAALAARPGTMAQQQLGTLLNAAPRAVAQRRMAQALGSVVQRVMIGDVDIDEDTDIADVEAALGWDDRWRWTNSKGLTKEQLAALIEALKDRDDCEEIVDDLKEELETESDKGDSSGEKEAVEKGDADGFESPEAALEARKHLAEAFGWVEFPEEINGFVKIGIHETRAENTATLVANGPSADRIDSSGHGIGKGRGFYVTPVGGKTLYNAVKAITYENNFVAIYIADDVEPYRSPGEAFNNVAALDARTNMARVYYVMSGGGEIIVPERCFGALRVAARIEDCDQW